jgi:hypothetical protein
MAHRSAGGHLETVSTEGTAPLLGVRARFLAAIDKADGEQPMRLCDACVLALPVQRAAIAVHVAGEGLEILCSSDHIAERLEWVQITVGEGPGWAAVSGGGPVFVTDLARGDARWPVFAAEAAGAGVGGMVAVPLQVGAIRVGVLDLYCDAIGPLSTSGFADAVAVAELVSVILLTVGRTGRVIESLGPWWDQPLSTREVHQATGMVMVQLGVDAGEAYVRLQAFAYANERLISEVARAVVGRQLRFDPDTP